MRAIFFERDDAEAALAALRALGHGAVLERERLAGEDDDEDHPWAVVTDAPRPAVAAIVDAHEGWLDAAPGPTGEAPAPPLPDAPRRIKRPGAAT